MTGDDRQFSGSIPQTYDNYMGPLVFQPYAEDLAARLAGLVALDARPGRRRSSPKQQRRAERGEHQPCPLCPARDHWELKPATP